MDTKLESYILTVDKNLKPLPADERKDILEEIKSSIKEMEYNNLSTEEIIKQLGDPNELAKGYLSNLLSAKSTSTWDTFLTVAAYYSLVGLSGVIIIPTLGITAPILIVFSVLTPIFGAFKLVDYLFGLHLTIAKFPINDVKMVNNLEFSPIIEFLVSIVFGIILYWLGRQAWRLLLRYCQHISKKQ